MIFPSVNQNHCLPILANYCYYCCWFMGLNSCRNSSPIIYWLVLDPVPSISITSPHIGNFSKKIYFYLEIFFKLDHFAYIFY